MVCEREREWCVRESVLYVCERRFVCCVRERESV